MTYDYEPELEFFIHNVMPILESRGLRLPAIETWPQEATLATAHLVLSGVTRRYPAIRWIVAEMGGTLPYLSRYFEEATASVGSGGGDLTAELRRLYYDTSLTDDPLVYKFMAEWIGTERIVLGTDSPRVTPTDWIARVKAIPGIGGADLERILGGTARTELNL